MQVNGRTAKAVTDWLAERDPAWMPQTPMILAITTRLSNTRSEGYNRIVNQVGRIAFGFRNP